MKKKGLVYRATTLLGFTVIFLQFGGELIYSKYIKDIRNKEIAREKSEEEKIEEFQREDDVENKQRKGLFASRQDYNKARLEKIKKAQERPTAPLMEELQAKPGYKEIKMRQLVLKSEDAAKEASKDDYI